MEHGMECERIERLQDSFMPEVSKFCLKKNVQTSMAWLLQEVIGLHLGYASYASAVQPLSWEPPRNPQTSMVLSSTLPSAVIYRTGKASCTKVLQNKRIKRLLLTSNFWDSMQEFPTIACCEVMWNPPSTPENRMQLMIADTLHPAWWWS